jgi:hypothetical protein
MVFGTSFVSPRGLVGWAAVVCVVALTAAPARAAFHLWQIQEVYTNSSGTLQFVELTDQFGFQNSVGGNSISVTNAAGTQTNTFTIPDPPPDFGTLPGDTLNHMLLFGTGGLHAAGGPTPDYIISNNFLFPGGGSISFFGANGGAYTALPTDGVRSLNWFAGTNNAVNSPVNYNGDVGVVTPVPEPTTLLLAPVAAVLGGVYRWRRRAATPPAA